MLQGLLHVWALGIILGGDAFQGAGSMQPICGALPAGAVDVLAGQLLLPAVAALGALVDAGEGGVGAFLPDESRGLSSSLVAKLAHQRSAPTPSTTIWLTRRQRELRRLLTQELDNRHIAQALEISVKTVENHLTTLYRVLGVDSRLKAVHYALRHPELLAISGQETRELEPLPQRNDQDLSVLVVDDNVRYRQQLTRLIGKICPTSILYEAGNISEAINLGQQIRPQLALIDVVLENEDGILCARQLRNVSPSTRMGVSMRQDATVRRDLDEKIRGIRDKIDSFINDSHRDSSRIRERLSAVEARLRSAEEVVLMCRQCNPHQHQRGHPHAYHGPFEPPEESTDVMSKLLEFWMGQSGRLSSTRLLATYTTGIVLAVWSIVSIRQNTINPLPESIVVLVLGATGTVQAPKFMKSGKPPAEQSEEVEEKK